MAKNTQPAVDIRNVMTGSDGCLYDSNGKLMATVESFQAQVSVTNQSFQPLGSAMERSKMTSYKITLTFTEVVVASGLFFKEIMDGLQSSNMPVFQFRGDMNSPHNDSVEQIVYRDCVPDGTIDIQNMQVGQLYKRNWSFVCNNPPEAMKYLN